jgi:hypothetical protein
MPQAVDRALGGILASDWETVAMHVEGTSGVLEPRMMDLGAQIPARPERVLLLFPNLGYRQQMATLVWAYIFSRLDGDLTLSNKLRLWIDGSEGVFNVPEAQQARFYDPRSGFSYVARRYGLEEIDGKLVDRGIASRMLEHANALLSGAYQVVRDSDGKPVLNEFGQPELVLDENGEAIALGELFATSNFSDYVGVLDGAVQIGNWIGHGPFNRAPVD